MNHDFRSCAAVVLGTKLTVGLPEICYIITVVGDGTAEQFERLHSKAIGPGPSDR